MDAIDVLKFQDEMVEKYHYRPLPPMFREEALKLYRENLPNGFMMDGDDVPLYSPGGLKLCSRYNRIVVGDYGPYVEILPEDIFNENIQVKKGQEYRDADERYSKHTKYSWLTANDGSDVKIYFQKKTVGYADYIPGRYYISPFECSLPKSLHKGLGVNVCRENVEAWLKSHGVFSNELLDYYEKVLPVHSDAFEEALRRDMFPGDLELWVKLNEVCDLPGGLSYQQYEAVSYNLGLINCTANDLKGQLMSLEEAVRTAITLGLEEFCVPYEAECLGADTLRLLLSFPAEKLLDVARLSKILAGCKCEPLVCNVQRVIRSAEERAVPVNEEHKEKELVF